MSKIDLKNWVNPDPDWDSMVGKSIQEVDTIVREKWPFPLKSDALGNNGFRCIQYQTQDDKVILMFDRDGCLLDVFEYGIEMDRPYSSPKI